MSEGFVELLGLGLGVQAAFRWYARLLNVRAARSGGALATQRVLMTLPILLLCALFFALRSYAAEEVRTHGEYVRLFLLLGVVWLAASLRAVAWLGISAIDDAIDRENPAAGCAVAGAMIAGTICYAFANFGEGATIWMTIGPAVLGFFACTALWALHQACSDAADAITIERDVASGLRFAGMAIGTSLIVGRSLAGDYLSAAATWDDLVHQSWPALPLVVLAVGVQRARRTHPHFFVTGLLPAVAYVSVGVADVVWLGAWSAGAGS